jgi:hypothetical protein
MIELWEAFTDLTPYAPLFAGIAGAVIAIGLVGVAKRRARQRLIAKTRAIHERAIHN